jgi:hypothetical protein
VYVRFFCVLLEQCVGGVVVWWCGGVVVWWWLSDDCPLILCRLPSVRRPPFDPVFLYSSDPVILSGAVLLHGGKEKKGCDIYFCLV